MVWVWTMITRWLEALLTPGVWLLWAITGTIGTIVCVAWAGWREASRDPLTLPQSRTPDELQMPGTRLPRHLAVWVAVLVAGWTGLSIEIHLFWPQGLVLLAALAVGGVAGIVMGTARY